MRYKPADTTDPNTAQSSMRTKKASVTRGLDAQKCGTNFRHVIKLICTFITVLFLGQGNENILHTLPQTHSTEKAFIVQKKEKINLSGQINSHELRSHEKGFHHCVYDKAYKKDILIFFSEQVSKTFCLYYYYCCCCCL